MENKRGFISMSLVYSFFIVFVAISISLLGVYTTNLSLVKNINKEIKDDLIEKGNDALVVFYNLIPDGSFERMTSVNEGTTDTTTDTWETSSCSCSYSNIVSGVKQPHKQIFNKHHYHGNNALHFSGSATGVQYAITKESIYMKDEHVYFIQRIYQAPYGVSASEASKMKMTFINENNSNKYFVIPNGAGLITRTTDRSASSWSGVTSPKTIESGVFTFSISDLPTVATTGNYKFKIEAQFTNYNTDFITDSYILIDLTEAYGSDNNAKLMADTGATTLAIESIIKNTFFEGRKIFSTFNAGLEDILN